MNLLQSAQAHALYKTMAEAHETFKNAGADYQSAMTTVIDTGANADGACAFRREGRAYAQALTSYADATMAWLVFVDQMLLKK